LFLTESYREKMLKLAGIEVIKEAINFTKQDLTKAYDKSGQRIMGFDIDMIKKAIMEGRAIGISYKSEDMPVTKFRIILPVTIGIYKTKSSVKMKLSAFHLAGQSEKAAQQSGVRSKETANVWRLFDLDRSKFKGMWFTDKFFYEYPPGYKKGDKRFESIQSEYDTGRAQLYQIEREKDGEKEGEPIQLRGVEAQGETPSSAPENKEIEKGQEANAEKGSQGEELYEKEKNPLYAKKPWLKYLRNGYKPS
jgi:hypothetical protein